MANLKHKYITKAPALGAIATASYSLSGVYCAKIENIGQQQVSYELTNGDEGILYPGKYIEYSSQTEQINDAISFAFTAESTISIVALEAATTDDTVSLLGTIATNTTPIEDLTDYYLKVPLGKIVGQGYIYKFGRNDNVNTGASNLPADIWNSNTAQVNYIFPTTAGALDIQSDAPDDADGSDGAHTLLIEGLDSGYNEISEEIAMDGGNTVTTANEYLRVNRVRVLKAGTEGANIGTIEVTFETSNMAAVILPRQNQTTQCIYTVPVGKEALITGGFVTVNRDGNTRDVDMSIKIRQFEQVFASKLFFGLNGGQFVLNPKGGMYAPEKSDIKVVCENTTVNSTDVSAALEMYLFDT